MGLRQHSSKYSPHTAVSFNIKNPCVWHFLHILFDTKCNVITYINNTKNIPYTTAHDFMCILFKSFLKIKHPDQTEHVWLSLFSSLHRYFTLTNIMKSNTQLFHRLSYALFHMCVIQETGRLFHQTFLKNSYLVFRISQKKKEKKKTSH